MRFARFTVTAALTLGALACSEEKITPGSGGAAGAAGVGGEAGGAPVLQVEAFRYTPAGTQLVVLGNGDPIELWAAPQGGHVSRVGARVRGLGTDTADLEIRVLDPVTQEVVSQGTRTSKMVPSAGGPPGAVESDRTGMYNVVHLALCPSNDGRKIMDTTYDLELKVTELYGDFTEGITQVDAVPTCDPTDPSLLEHCVCECGADYDAAACVPGFDGGDGGA